MSRTPLYLCVLFVAPAVARSPAGSPPDLVQLAESQIVAGQRPEAAATYRQALEVLERLPPEELTASQPEIELALRRLAFLSAKYGEGARSLPSFLALSEPREGADPLLSALARYHAGYASLQTDGDLDRAREIWKPLGFLESWWVVGSFDNERGGSFHTAYGPEKDIDLEAVYDGKKRPIHWRRLPARPVAGRVDLDALFRPSDECLAYALTFVHSESDQPAALRLGSDEGYKVWVNGDLAGSEDLHRRALFDQSVVGIRLLRGWNSVLLKIAEAKGSWEFRARLGRPDGRPLEGWREGQLEPDALEPDSLADVRQRFRRAAESRGKNGEGEAPAKGEAVACHRGVVEQLRKRIAGSPADARAHYLLGTLLLERRAHDTSQHPDTEALRQALKIDDSAVITYHSLARSYQRQTRVAAERDDNSWRQAMEQAAARGSVLASYRLAAYYLNTFRNYRAARHHLDRVLQANPRMVGAILLRGQLESALEYPLSWEKAVAAALEAAPESFRALSAHADLLVSRGGVTGAERLVRDLLARNHLARDRRATLVQLLVDRGKSEEARHWIELGERLRPFGTGAREQLASLALARDDAAEAVRHLSRALEIRPEDHGLHEKRGRAQWRLDDREAALASWSRALELQPNLPDLRERVDFLRSREKSFEDEFRRPTAELIAKELELTPPSGEEEPARILLQTTAVEVNRDGTSREFVQTVVQVLNDGGVRSFDVFSTTYAAGDQHLEFKKARVHRRDGTTADANLSRHRGRGRSGYRRASVDLPSLSPGDIFEVEYIREDITQSFFGDYYGRREFFQGNLSIADKAFVLRVPASRKFHFHQRNLDLERERHEDAENEQVTYTWRKKDIPRVEPEPGMPPAQELYPLLEISTFADWEEFSGWYHNLIKKQFEASPEIVAKVQELSSGARNDLERIRAIYNFVVTEIRYNAWEFGVHGFKPYNASTVFTRKFGDCK
ncbi:MAG: DUF3857 domain-containing protein, partial [Planctomycetota bacterium]|nr:DUF3857 domain-containing protein [Planctomycetota bacterium]